jgi:flagellar protein FlgJ
LSIKPTSDLLLDVARAADPATSAAAAERLAKIAGQAGKDDPAFSQVLADVGPPPAKPARETEPALPSSVAPRMSGPVDPAKKAYQGFEALLLQNLVSTMLPKDSDLFGEGSAGEIWRSMLAEQLGTELSKDIDLGIAPKSLRLGSHGSKTASASHPLDTSLKPLVGTQPMAIKHS